MLRNYVKIAFRNLYKNKMFAILNILGLSVALAICMVGYVNYEFSQSFNSMHKNKSQIHLITSNVSQGNYSGRLSYSSVAMAPLAKSEIPGIKKLTRLSYDTGSLGYEDKVFNHGIMFTDYEFFEMFSFPFIEGGYDSFVDKNSVVINDEIAQKYFGDESAVGKVMTFRSNNGELFNFNVIGVVEKPPINSNIVFTIIVPYENIEGVRGYDINDWGYWSRATFIQINEDANLKDIENKLQKYIAPANQKEKRFQIQSYELMPLMNIANETHGNLGGHPFRQGMHSAAIVAPSVAALLVLLLACFNFVNTSVAFSAKRLKEIGLRKVMGGLKSQLITQFMTENFILCLISILIAMGFAEIFVPAYDSLWPEISLSLSYSSNLNLILFLLGLLFITAVAAGVYPALFISKFHPVEIFKGKQKLGGTNPVIRIMLTGQLALSMVAIIASVIMSNNADYINKLDLGFNSHNVLIIDVYSESDYKVLKDAIESFPEIESIAGTKHKIARYWQSEETSYEETNFRSSFFAVGENYIETMGLKILKGRSFDYQSVFDKENGVIVNEQFVQQMGWDDPIDKEIFLGIDSSKQKCRIIGVVENFYHNGVSSVINPTVFKLTPEDKYSSIIISFKEGTGLAVNQKVNKDWKNLFPLVAYESYWQKDTIDDDKQVNNSIRLVFLYIAVMVLIISGMGLFALVSLNIAKRYKELSIRKILGATVTNISKLIIKEFVIMITVGGILASIIGYYLVRSLLSSIWTYYTDFGIAPYILSALIILIVTVLTVGSQIYYLATSNPVEAIKNE